MCTTGCVQRVEAAASARNATLDGLIAAANGEVKRLADAGLRLGQEESPRSSWGAPCAVLPRTVLLLCGQI